MSARWILKKKAGKRFLSGHPWVFSNEIENVKTLAPGDLVQLFDPSGQFLALGYGNPHSLIAFRTLDRKEKSLSLKDFVQKLIRAYELREAMGMTQASFRWVFSEADALPGLILDRYLLEGGKQVLVAQILTAGMEKLFNPEWIELALQGLQNAIPWEKTELLIKRDSSARKLEGLEVIPAQGNSDLRSSLIQIASSSGNLTFETDLLEGQKTGFFLDQRRNVEMLLEFLMKEKRSSLRVLDLFCYVGQWSAQIAAKAKRHGISAETFLLDASQEALRFAEKNVRRSGGNPKVIKMDIPEKLGSWEEKNFDVVICDPPAFMKSKAHLMNGARAYQKLNEQALRKLKSGGWILSSSCSHHLKEDHYLEILSQAALKSGRSIQWVARGFQSPDHPVLASFPEGHYLKAWLGRVLD